MEIGISVLQEIISYSDQEIKDIRGGMINCVCLQNDIYH